MKPSATFDKNALTRLGIAFFITFLLQPLTALASFQLPIEVFAPGYNNQSVSIYLDSSQVSQITHLYLRCNRCGYQNKALDADPAKIKATVIINDQAKIDLKHYTAGQGGLVGNPEITIIGPEQHYGGIGGGFRTVRFTIPVAGLLQPGDNTLTFSYQDKDTTSIGFRIIELNFLTANVRNVRQLSDNLVLEEGNDYVVDDPDQWRPPLSDSDAQLGQMLWRQRNLLTDPNIGQFREDGSNQLRASCADCHARNGRDLFYFNFSNASIISRARFHGLGIRQAKQIASYIRSLKQTGLDVVAKARPWNPPYQPGTGINESAPYRWAAGAGIDAVLAKDSDMQRFLFPQGTNLNPVRQVVDRKSTLNMRKLPIAMSLPEWNQWLPPIHPDDALNLNSRALNQDEKGNNVGQPYYRYLYNIARNNPSRENLGEMLRLLKKWSSRGATCYANSKITRGTELRALNGLIWDGALAFKNPRLNQNNCERNRTNESVQTVEVAKQALIGWVVVKYWEIIHSNNLETEARKQGSIVYQNEGRINVAESLGWVLDSQTLFNRVPHFLSHMSDHYISQDPLVGAYENSAWYHLNMVVNTGYRETMPSHFIYTLNWIGNLHDESQESQSFRYWATLIKMRQLQTNGRYGIEEGLDLRTAQPYFLHSDRWGDTSLPGGVEKPLWNNLTTAFIENLLADAQYATVNDWANAANNSQVQSKDEFVPSLVPASSRDKIFNTGRQQGLNTYRLIPRLKQQGVSPTTIESLADWSKTMWGNRSAWNAILSAD